METFTVTILDGTERMFSVRATGMIEAARLARETLGLRSEAIVSGFAWGRNEREFTIGPQPVRIERT